MTDLILVPTPLEMQPLRRMMDTALADRPHAFQLCGFGPIAAAARAAALIARYRPSRMLLVGIAGTFDADDHSIGTACRFDEVVCDGVGVGTGDDFHSAASMGWLHFGARGTRPQIGDTLPLISTFVSDVACAGQLLTCPSASANRSDAQCRRQRYPDAAAEDMEGFGVATACALAGVPLQIVRGLSNLVGDRDKTNWRIDDALFAAAAMSVTLVRRAWMPSEV